MAIGVFDSGVGGLTVFSSLAKNFPKLDMYYLGDTARVPYGSRSKDTIIRYSLECAEYLISNFSIEALVVACNTASSYALDVLRHAYGIPVIGVVEPGAEKALSVSESGKIGVIGTRGTIRSGSYRAMLESKCKNDSLEIYEKACPLFVPLVEEMMIDNDIARLTVKNYLDSLTDSGIDTLILGCTHYPVLKNLIKDIYPAIKVVDSSEVILEYVKALPINFMEYGNRNIFVTDESPAFETLKNVLVGGTPIKLATLEPLPIKQY